MAKIRIEAFDVGGAYSLDACVALLVRAFEKPERYSLQRLRAELQPETGPFYRQFFVALDADQVIGFGAVKAADWASHTHVLTLSAVAREYRGQGLGRALLRARVEWVEQNFKTGRILVSSARAKRFHELGFVPIPKSGIEGRHIMMRRF